MKTILCFLFATIAVFSLASPVLAVEVQMGYDGNLIFEPAEITINAGESVHFVNNMLPPHNVIVEDRADLSHEALAMTPGEEFDVTFPEAGDFNFWCDPHKGAGMTGVVHVQ
jgi:plastocyanin